MGRVHGTYDTRNTRTFDTFKINLKRKVVLAKIPAHFLVGDRRPNVLYARLRRNCMTYFDPI
jgi:hypothetical protein